jgi:hypothetical protein
VIHYTSDNSNQPLCSTSSSDDHRNAAASCRCTNTIFHLLSCSVPISKRVSLYFTSPSTVLPRNYCSFNVEQVMSQRITLLPDASDAQKQLINVGNSVSRATCSLKQDAWSTFLASYVPCDPCYTAEVLVAGMKYGSLMSASKVERTANKRQRQTDTRDMRRD